ncbi:hypothetical protein CHLNCDRAFT_144160 [Chlorella variabilis]|uniref:Glutathione S-transferase 3, mitochondrial n=1 Tax=Chlorella variabilis TaxID=554065 RepID=E1ZC19_CHLVA|nr:hypothetical protein CHLNCDRAFT_144160 [Chlorella variabilis]EFN56532.1 hypothetical protein CHLNCDRAFT_144160 [Chlorella variabilis]|eukprot:XP_005848634.1 hypothetical protein CHLNCDRAFT_144160 [Chlorella variabilis]
MSAAGLPSLRLQVQRRGTLAPSRVRLRVAAVALPPNYGWVMTSVAFTAAVVQWQAARVMKARKECGVAYPTLYAPGTDELATRFNCTQRAHQNSIEMLPQQLAMQMLVGLVYPRAAAAQGLVWAIGRILYTRGYSTGDPAQRAPGGSLAWMSYLCLMVATAVVGIRMVLGM